VTRDRWIWVPLDAVLAIHDEHIAEHGGIAGVRDLAVVDSALARPRNVAASHKSDAAELAAAYVFGLCDGRGFRHGRRRTAYVVAETFLDLNGYAVTASDEQVVKTMRSVASGVIPEGVLAKWFRTNIASAPRS
jgi:death-on-curing protein